MKMVGARAWHLRILASIAGGICVGVGVGVDIGIGIGKGMWCSTWARSTRSRFVPHSRFVKYVISHLLLNILVNPSHIARFSSPTHSLSHLLVNIPLLLPHIPGVSIRLYAFQELENLNCFFNTRKYTEAR